MAQALQHIRTVDATGRNSDQHLAAGRRGHGPLSHTQHLWRTETGNLNDLHRLKTLGRW